MKNKKISLIAGLAIVASFTLGACSSSKDDSASETDASTTEQPAVTVDPEIQSQLNVEPGSAIIPGSIESVEQTLSAECETAVAPIRDLMVKYPSVRQVPPDGTWEKAFAEGKKCEEIDAQQWTDFYTKELAGWLYAKTDE
jgi:hypothetical protein